MNAADVLPGEAYNTVHGIHMQLSGRVFCSSALPFFFQKSNQCSKFLLVTGKIGLSLERVSIECSKSKTKVITLANQKGQRQSSNSKLKVITRNRHKARENVHA